MTKKKIEKKKVVKPELESPESIEPGEILHAPSEGFRCLGIWPRAKGNGVIIVGIDPFYGRMIGLLGSGYGGTLGDLTWVLITRGIAESLRNLANSETPIGLCGSRIVNGKFEEDIWVTFLQEDLESLEEATKMIFEKLI